MNDGIVLLVEDNDDDVVLTQRAFKRQNIRNQLVVVRDGAEAVDFLFGTGAYAGRNTEVPPVLILLDLKLPKVDGLEVLRQIRKDPRTKYVPVVVLTSSREEKDVIKSYHLGCNSYVRKPVNFEEFAEAIRELGLYWLILNEPIPRTGHEQAAESADR